MPDPTPIAGIRTEKASSYITMVRDTIVTALRLVFDADYPEQQFQSMRIVTEYALTESTHYPAIYVRFNPRQSLNAGVGHEEWFGDDAGQIRKWYHRRFEGSIDFVLEALTPTDLDILIDSMHQVLEFGRLDPGEEVFFTSLYGDPNDSTKGMSVLKQLALQTDVVRDMSGQPVPAPWASEDQLVYNHTVSVECMGGYYNSPPNSTAPQFISAVSVYPYLADAIMPLTDGNTWRPAFEYSETETFNIRFDASASTEGP